MHFCKQSRVPSYSNPFPSIPFGWFIIRERAMSKGFETKEEQKLAIKALNTNSQLLSGANIEFLHNCI